MLMSGNEHTTVFNVHCVFTDPQFIEESPVTRSGTLPHDGYTLLCTAHAICDHYIATHPAALSEKQYAWLLLMAAAYVHRFCADISFDDKSFARLFSMDESAFAVEFMHFLQLVYNMPPSPTKVRNDDPRRPAERNEFLGPVVKVYPFQL